MRNRRIFLLGFAGLVAMSGLMFSDGFSAGQEAARSEVAFEEEMVRAEAFFERNAYKEAAESYLKAAALTSSAMSKSRAYLGLSLCAYYQQDLSGTRFWMEKILEIDPNKEISALFYPAAFVQLFSELREAARSAPAPDVRSAAAASPPRLPAAPLTPRPEEFPVETEIPPVVTGGFFTRTGWQDILEIETHVSSWSLNPILRLVSDTLSGEMGKVIRNEVRNEVRRIRSDMSPASDEIDIALGSSGSNAGFGIRIYPRGRTGSFSLGVSLEKTVMKLKVDGTVIQDFVNGSRAAVDATAYVETRPWSTNMNFRWDFLPSHRLTPYFVFGVGLASLDGIVGYSYTGTYNFGGVSESLGASDEKDFKSAEEEIGDNIPNILVIVQACLGLRAEIFGGLSLRAEAGLWDGIMFRGGLSYRF